MNRPANYQRPRSLQQSAPDTYVDHHCVDHDHLGAVAELSHPQFCGLAWRGVAPALWPSQFMEWRLTQGDACAPGNDL